MSSRTNFIVINFDIKFHSDRIKRYKMSAFKQDLNTRLDNNSNNVFYNQNSNP